MRKDARKKDNMNLKDYQKGRNDGLALAWRIVREGGAEALEKEIKERKATGINVNMSMKEMETAILPIKELTIRTVLAMSVATLRDEYGFGKERLQRFADRFILKTNCMSEGWLAWKDLCENIKEETGIHISYDDMFDTSKV